MGAAGPATAARPDADAAPPRPQATSVAGLAGSSIAGFPLNSNIQGYPEIYIDVCDIKALLSQTTPDFAGPPPPARAPPAAPPPPPPPPPPPAPPRPAR
jgi:hypothetical protein